ncbi:MAG: hypothetical protein HY236_05685 [Acidobacteria bacterium]|nr:hypothetical protein [Acidobacteriota bacterium]
MFKEVNFNSTYRKNSFPSLAIGTSGAIYDVYADQQKGNGAEIEFCATAGTAACSPVIINNASTGQQFMPSVTVDSQGYIHASWFDTRNSSATSQYDIYATYSGNGGASFAPNARVTSGLVNAGSASFIGDYAGIAAAPVSSVRYAHPVWTSGGFNNGQLQTAALTAP